MFTNTNIMDQIAAPENLLAAWRAVRGNIPKYRRQHAAGPDGVTMRDFEHELQPQLAALRDMLISGRYYPTPAAHFKLPKHGGGERIIAVLTVRERVAQRAAQQVLEPFWEREFLPCSFGFRPGLSIDQAVAYLQNFRQHGERWTVDGDIASCFDSIDHDILMARLETKVRDLRVLKLLQNWLDAGLMQSGLPTDVEPQAAIDDAKRKQFIQEGVGWIWKNLTGSSNTYFDNDYDDYEDFGINSDQPRSIPNSARKHPFMHVASTPRDYLGLLVRRILLGGMMLGSGLVRPFAQRAAHKAATSLRGLIGTPAGRRMLKKSSVLAGGLAGAAAITALAAWIINQRAGAGPIGVLQGSPLSPLLANIYLHPFDEQLTKSGCHLVRFADDWVIPALSREQAERAYNNAVKTLARLKLKINPQKTHILSPEDRLEWLGVVIP